MYIDHFGLTDYPFRAAPDLEYFYPSRGQSRARSYIDFSLVSGDGLVVITGDVGSGKTLLLRKLLTDLPHYTPLVHIEQTQLTPTEFLQAVWQQLGQELHTDSKVELLQCLKHYLQQLNRQSIRAVIAIDEAQRFSIDVLEEIRMLSDVGTSRDKLLSFVLLGQPDLDRLLDRPEMEQFRQRARLRFRLRGLSRTEIWKYIRKRLSVAGAKEPERIFPVSCCPLIEEYTGGIPRLVNTLCDMSLLFACVDNCTEVNEAVVREAIKELEWPKYAERKTNETTDTGPGGSSEQRGNSVVVPMTLMRRLADALERVDGHLERIANAVAPAETDAKHGEREQ